MKDREKRKELREEQLSREWDLANDPSLKGRERERVWDLYRQYKLKNYPYMTPEEKKYLRNEELTPRDKAKLREHTRKREEFFNKPRDPLKSLVDERLKAAKILLIKMEA